MTDIEESEEEYDWKGVLDDIDIRYVPIEYLNSITVTFFDEKKWIFEIEPEDHDFNKARELEEYLQELFDDYEDVIENIDFHLNVKKIKKDIKEKTFKLVNQNKE